jgi:hypothetical protein
VTRPLRTCPSPENRSRLLPEGRRWGFGAHTLVPYLTMALQARPASDEAVLASIRNPVFPQMEKALRVLRSEH